MISTFRLTVLTSLFALVACSENNAPATLEQAAGQALGKAEITAPKAPAAVIAEVEPPPASTKPVGPHGQHDPHASLDPDRLVKVALQHDSEGRRELALKTLAEGIDRFPDASQLYAVRASMRLQMQQVSAALSDLEQAVVLAPSDPGIRVNRAQAYRSFGRYLEARQDLDRAIAAAPDLIPARFNRGALLYAQNEFDAALADFDHCIAIDPHTPAPYFNRASTYWELNRPDDAMRDLDRFVELSDNDQWKQAAIDLKKNWETALATKPAAKGEDS